MKDDKAGSVTAQLRSGRMDASMANGLTDVVSKERIEAAVNLILRLRAQQNGAPLQSLAWAAVEETFLTCVTGADDAVEHHLSAMHAALVADVLQRAERCLGEPAQAGTREYSSPPCMMQELDPAFMEYPERPSPPAGLPTARVVQDWEEVRLWRKAKRAVLIERRLAMPATKRVARSEAITAALVQVLSSCPGALIGFYWPFKGEYDPRPLVRSLHAKGTRLALPVVVEKAKPLIFREWWPGVPMASGIWNIPVPEAGEPVLPDVLLVPLVGFDCQGYRLGYGGGYYDRTLAALLARPRAIGVGFKLSQISTIHPQQHDLPMDLVVTERGTFLTTTKSEHALMVSSIDQ